jgi:hypothetical protein
MFRPRFKKPGRSSALGLTFCFSFLLTANYVSAQLPYPFDMSTVDGTNGLRFDRSLDEDETGIAVSGTGDVNGDGYEDFLVGGGHHAHTQDEGFGGEAYLVYGAPSYQETLGILNRPLLNGSNGVRIGGNRSYASQHMDLFGSSVAGGDVNGDGYSDLIIGDPIYSRLAGSVYVLYGSPNGIGSTGTFDVSTLDGANGCRIDGEDARLCPINA